MSRHHFRIAKLSDAEKLLPGFSKLWARIKSETGTRQARPKSLTFTDIPAPMILDDSSCGRRWALNLETMELGGGIHVSAGEWAVHAGKNHVEPVEGLPGNAAVISAEWNDFHRCFSLEIQVAKLPQSIGMAS